MSNELPRADFEEGLSENLRVTHQALFLEYLQALQEKGEQTIFIEDDVRLILREWMKAARRGQRAFLGVKEESPMAVPEEREGQKAQDILGIQALYQAEEQREKERAGSKGNALYTQSPELRDIFEVKAEELSELSGLSLDGRKEALTRLYGQRVSRRQECEMGALGKVFVGGVGSLEPKILFVTDCPGHLEEQSVFPLRGMAGEKFQDILKAMGLGKQDFFLTPLLKFRPQAPQQTTNTRKVERDELELGISLLRAECRLLAPSCLVLFGENVAQAVLGEEATLEEMQQKKYEWEGIPVLVSVPPRFLLLSEAREDKRAFWEGMLQAMTLGGLPVTEKQAGYFLPKKS